VKPQAEESVKPQAEVKPTIKFSTHTTPDPVRDSKEVTEADITGVHLLNTLSKPTTSVTQQAKISTTSLLTKVVTTAAQFIQATITPTVKTYAETNQRRPTLRQLLMAEIKGPSIGVVGDIGDEPSQRSYDTPSNIGGEPSQRSYDTPSNIGDEPSQRSYDTPSNIGYEASQQRYAIPSVTPTEPSSTQRKVTLKRMVSSYAPENNVKSSDSLEDLATQLATNDVILNNDVVNDNNNNTAMEDTIDQNNVAHSASQYYNNENTALKESNVASEVEDKNEVLINDAPVERIVDPSYTIDEYPKLIGEGEPYDYANNYLEKRSEINTPDVSMETAPDESDVTEEAYDNKYPVNSIKTRDIKNYINSNTPALETDPNYAKSSKSIRSVPDPVASLPDKLRKDQNILDLPPNNDNIDWGKELPIESYLKNKFKTIRDIIPGRRRNIRRHKKYESMEVPYINFLKRSYFPKAKTVYEDPDKEILPFDGNTY